MIWLIAGAAILAVLVLILVLPVYLEMDVMIHGRVDFKLRMYFFFRLFCLDLVHGRRGVKPSVKAPGHKRKAPALSCIFRALRVKGLLKHGYLP